MTDYNNALVEFIGGPSDGRTMLVSTPYMGRPPHCLRMPVAPSISLDFDQVDSTYSEPNEALYECTGVMSDDRHTWPYLYRGLQ